MKFLVAAIVCFLVSCSPHQDPNEPAALNEGQAEVVEMEGLRIQATAYDDPDSAGAAFGFDIHGAGLLPLRFVLQNRSANPIRLIPSQIFLIDQGGQAWPLLTSEQVTTRLGSAGDAMSSKSLEDPPPESAGSLTPFALDLVTVADFLGNAHSFGDSDGAVRQRFSGKSLRNPGILAGQSAFALLFFPVRELSHGVQALRVGFEQAGRQNFLTLPIKSSASTRP